ncbi:pantoate--beta-alanine ligase [Vannielia litorea]|uniref:pantoate--beta-alanine ligase n=1 Tax=Vannielia litorea TaxID=1217970 RepID=UPI001BCB7A06|nr:pantoate--beta-alanine ligase [Vannielia litorea]MBS8225798.1 pantoate--beta-alanine ligase [Vannielia litorea]
MDVCTTIPDLRRVVRGVRAGGHKVGFVPTMGYLHAGHMRLVEEAQARAEAVVVSIFVNPTQFGDPKDLETYPRNTERDLQMLRDAGVNAVLMPQVADIYPDGAETVVETEQLANMLHGAVRPGHYRGVCTVVAKLFNIVQPDFACFGEKDYQQLQIIRTMVRDLHFPLEILPVPTVREADGLAMSSRNARLTPEDRAAAVVLSRALDAAEDVDGTVEEISEVIRSVIATEPRAALRGLDITEARSLAPVSGQPRTTLAVMISAEFGGILLIDQREITPKGAPA